MTETGEQKPGSSPEVPAAVGYVGRLISEYISRLGTIWVEGQISEVRKSGALTYITLRDVAGEEVLKLYAPAGTLETIQPPVEQGSRVVAQVKADWWPRRGTMQFKVLQIRAVGLGELLARLEALKVKLASEGLFAPERKRPLPFLPRRVGLICGRNSDAMHDVMKNAHRRWPDVVFEVREVAVQGTSAAGQVSQAVRELDAIDDIDVIVITRGGGSFEDLLAFSDESLLRTVAAAQTPIVSAIGHEEDHPLLDFIADYRASTPTDAARRIVPDLQQELTDIANLQQRLGTLIHTKLTAHEQELALLRSRPALAHPALLIDQRIMSNEQLRTNLDDSVRNALKLEGAHLQGIQNTLRALSPQGTLERGFAIVRDAQGHVIKQKQDSKPGEILSVRLADGEISVTRQ